MIGVRPDPRALAPAALMFMAVLLTLAVTPHVRVGGAVYAPDLEALIPRAFGEWKIDDDALEPISAEVPGDDRAGRIYSQVLNRTYVDDSGRQVMLTLAYGGEQSDALAVHRPEVCYSAQGFKVTIPYDHVIHVADRELEVRVLAAQLGARFEPITYWFVIGDRVATGRMQRKIEQLKYGLTGSIPDGMLVRVSSIEKDTAKAFQLHERFVNDLVGALDADGKTRLIGR